MAHFEHSSVINAPRKKVFDFLTDLEKIGGTLPGDYGMEVLSNNEKPKRGAQYDLRMSRFGISVNWTVVVEEFSNSKVIRYRQSQGPFDLWVATLRFEDHAGGTLVTDIVDYELPFGLFGKLAEDLLMDRELTRFFATRNSNLEKLL